MLVTSAAMAGNFPGIGRTATPAEIRAWDIDVRPDFKGLPPGSGSVAKGQEVWEAKCASCHGTFAESNDVFMPLVGGTTAQDIKAGRVKTLVTGDVFRTTFMKLSSISTLWDYVNRAMPWNAPKSLSTEEVYASVAYLLNLADIVPADFTLSDRNMAEVQQRLPNRDGMTRDHGFWDVHGKPDVKNVACMKDCPAQATLGSAFPETAKGSHGDLAGQNRAVGPARAEPNGMAAEKGAVVSTSPVDLARQKGCLACHGIDKRVVGPAFREVAERYKGQPGIGEKLLDKVHRGGSGAWGAVPMPANPDLAPADGAAIVEWILAGAR